jgi:hypothetical protein
MAPADRRSGSRPAGNGRAAKTVRERADERREALLEDMREAIASGRLVVRQMTAEERRKFPPRPTPSDGRGSGRRRR